jgi:hypothetical protein
MKKTYIVPKVQILDYQSAQMIASSMGVYSSTTVNTEEEGVQLGNSRRGSWGDLWSEN